MLLASFRTCTGPSRCSPSAAEEVCVCALVRSPTSFLSFFSSSNHPISLLPLPLLLLPLARTLSLFFFFFSSTPSFLSCSSSPKLPTHPPPPLLPPSKENSLPSSDSIHIACRPFCNCFSSRSYQSLFNTRVFVPSESSRLFRVQRGLSPRAVVYSTDPKKPFKSFLQPRGNTSTCICKEKDSLEPKEEELRTSFTTFTTAQKNNCSLLVVVSFVLLLQLLPLSFSPSFLPSFSRFYSSVGAFVRSSPTFVSFVRFNSSGLHAERWHSSCFLPACIKYCANPMHSFVPHRCSHGIRQDWGPGSPGLRFAFRTLRFWSPAPFAIFSLLLFIFASRCDVQAITFTLQKRAMQLCTEGMAAEGFSNNSRSRLKGIFAIFNAV